MKKRARQKSEHGPPPIAAEPRRRRVVAIRERVEHAAYDIPADAVAERIIGRAGPARRPGAARR